MVPGKRWVPTLALGAVLFPVGQTRAWFLGAGVSYRLSPVANARALMLSLLCHFALEAFSHTSIYHLVPIFASID